MDYHYPFTSAESKAGSPELRKLGLKKQVISLLYSAGSLSISDLCQPTRTSIPTMTSIVNELIEDRWVSHAGTGESSGGRRPALYCLSGSHRYIAGVDLSQRHSRIGVFNLQNKAVSGIVELGEGLETSTAILDVIRSEMQKLLKQCHITGDQVLGYGISIPGLLDVRNDISLSYNHFGGESLSKVFGNLFGGMAYLEHDTRILAVSEAWFGLARNKSNVLCLNFGSGVGLGIISNGMLYHGHSGFAGEFGHIPLDPNGRLCYCGKTGCLETMVSGRAMVDKAIKDISRGRGAGIMHLAQGKKEHIDLNVIMAAANSGDPLALELIAEAGDTLARGLAILIHIMNPEMIIIGGEISQTGRLFAEAVTHKLSHYTLGRMLQETKVEVSTLGRNAILLGTIPLVMTNMFAQGILNFKPLFTKQT